MAIFGRVPARAACAAVVATLLAVAALSGWFMSDEVPNSGLRDLTDTEQIIVERAERILTERCMRQAGFQYWVGPIPGLEFRQGNGYVLSDVGWAKKYGYGRELNEKMAKLTLNDPNAAYAKKLAEPERIRYTETLYGTSKQGVLSIDLPTGGTIRTLRGGCYEEAEEQLYGDFPTWFHAKTIATNVTSLYAPDIVKDERFRRALTAWATCMRAAGHPFSDPPEIREWRDRINETMAPDEIQAAEVEVAVAEATCARDTPLLHTARTLEHEYRTKRLKPYQADITKCQDMSLAALARARTITGAAS